ncbi:Glycosylphosphatidylinositol anchor biosynthesis protein 11 [Erysiphe neolycopersici]|uniref:Glycosylphosphatidylinositol anchor biosynthesis protein 11 n=1 Tax=Erysiphe neolycopersici TaxID=212602 RepID=A0A420HJQ8_9PEZI|nr:Glycosylphosphatidylinositol anchor biosynthesis protein 11 [Erysiphe neolycopersici]
MNQNTKPDSRLTIIEIFPTSLARISSLAHPILLLSAYVAQFSYLVVDPLQALLNFLFPLTIIQIAYVAVCLPIAGFSSPSATPSKSRARSVVKSKKPVKSPSQALTVFIALILSGIAVPVLTAIQILLGAPFTSHLPLTILSSTHLSLLSLFPLIYVHGTDSEKWKQILSVYCPLDEVYGASIGAFIGGWLGAIPIPLDWDREWQKWPITIVTGIYLGYTIGKFVGGKVFKGKMIELE